MVFLKKIIIIFLLVFIYVYFACNKINDVNIPNEAIRFRIIANDNSKKSQKIKFNLNLKVNKLLNNLVNSNLSYNEFKDNINYNLDKIDIEVMNYLLDNNYKIDYKVNFGKNYFPNKEYKGIKYKEGYYDSLVITLGNGLGNNWWCILYPPLCNLEDEKIEDSQYRVYVYDLISKIKI